MIDRMTACLCATVWLGLLRAAAAVAGTSETDEVLRLLPNNVAACLILEDLSENLSRASKTNLADKFAKLPSVQKWKDSQAHKSFEQLVQSLPVYFGIPNQQLMEEIFGESVVLAFCPPSEGASATGILACRAPSESTLATVVERITGPTPSRKVVRHEHRGVAFIERTEFGSRHDFVLRIGPVFAMSDKPEAIVRVIDASMDGGGLYDVAAFRDMRASIGDGAMAQLLLHTQSLTPLVRKAMDKAGPVTRIFDGVWESLDWATVSLKLTDHAQLELSASVDESRLRDVDRIWPDLLARPSRYWDRVPASAMAAVASEIDFVALSQWLASLGQGVPEIGEILSTVANLLVGFDVNHVLGRLGPEVGATAIVSPAGELQVVAEIEFRPTESDKKSGLPLPETLELVALRPLLVFYSIDHNRQFGDQTKVVTSETNGRRLHTLTGSRQLPPWLEPTFAVEDGRVILASSPAAIEARRQAPSEPLASSPEYAAFRRATGADAVLKGYLSVRRLRDYLVDNQKRLAGEIAGSQQVAGSMVEGHLDDLAGFLSLVDFVTLSTATNGQVRKWTLSVFPNCAP